MPLMLEPRPAAGGGRGAVRHRRRRLLPVPGDPRGHDRVRGRGRPVAGRRGTGGVASRLTSHPADESYPAISPDGTTLAFSAAYEGPTEVYTMPLAGGSPRAAHVRRRRGAGRRLRAGRRARLLDAAVQHAARHAARPPRPRAPARARPCRSPRPRTAPGRPTGARSSSPGSRSRAATRSATAAAPRRASGSTRRERRRRCRSPADYAGTSKTPMWWSGRVYFLSDRDGTMNVWSMDEDGRDLRQHTRHKGWDARPGRRSRTAGSSTSWAPTCASSTSRAAPTRRSTSGSRPTSTRSARAG